MSFASASAVVNGSIIAYTVDISGSNFVINWIDNPSATPRFTVELLD